MPRSGRKNAQNMTRRTVTAVDAKWQGARVGLEALGTVGMLTRKGASGAVTASCALPKQCKTLPCNRNFNLDCAGEAGMYPFRTVNGSRYTYLIYGNK